MLLPHTKLRKIWLQRTLRAYPLYDPPHKAEERLLSRDKAAENFDYFMRVRRQRVVYFTDWLRHEFRAKVPLDEEGVRALNRWGNKYAGLLLRPRSRGDALPSPYFTYNPPWTGENAGYSTLFDMGMAYGEIIIAKCPKLYWDVDPISAVLPRTARMFKHTRGLGFQRPKLTGFDNPAAEVDPLGSVYGFAHQMMSNMTTFDGFSRYQMLHRESRRNIRDELINDFSIVLRSYPAADDAYKLRQQLSPEDYLKFIDAAETEGWEHGNE